MSDLGGFQLVWEGLGCFEHLGAGGFEGVRFGRFEVVWGSREVWERLKGLGWLRGCFGGLWGCQGGI